MGGLFSAQSADPRSVWGAKKRTYLMRQLGQLHFSPRGHPLWATLQGNTLSPAQLRDNVLVGALGRIAQREMQSLCDVLSQVWNLPVPCDCVTVDQRVCTNKCIAPSLTAMGFTTHLGTHCPPPNICTAIRVVSELGSTQSLCKHPQRMHINTYPAFWSVPF